MAEIVSASPYRQVAEHYRQAIRSGQLAPGVQMPTTKAVAAEYGIAMSTAARALALLRDEGWIVSRPSKPSVVAERPPSRPVGDNA